MIDFSTLQGLTIPEGVVSQITDASGRVLWSSAPPFDGFVYLRPSADISVEGTPTLVPSDATAVYLLINEEECDGAATEVKISGTGSDRVYATFGLSGAMPNKINRVKDINIHAVIAMVGNFKYRNFSTALILNGTTRYNYLTQIIYDDGAGYLPYKYGNVTTRVDLATNAYESITDEDFLSDINGYITAHGVLPDITLSVMLGIEEDDDDSKTEHSVALSQIYVALECE